MRLFIGIRLNSSVRTALAKEADSLRAHMRGNFSIPSNYHITLVFLGGHEADELPAIRAAVTEVAARAPFDIGVGGLGSFRKGGRAVMWAGVERAPELVALQAALVSALHARGVAFADEGTYTPHITLARQCEVMPLPKGAEGLKQCVDAVTLFESGRVDGELRYTPRFTAELKR